MYDNILSLIENYQEEYGLSPTVREIANEMELSVSTTQFYLDSLVKKEMISRSEGTRGLALAKDTSPKLKVPLVGEVACGSPIYAYENIEEYLTISKSILGSGDFFALYAKGDSMIDAGVSSGDIVIVRKQNTASDGDIVVALIEDEATLKYFYKDKVRRKVILKAANPAYQDMELNNVAIQGKAVKVFKDL